MIFWLGWVKSTVCGSGGRWCAIRQGWHSHRNLACFLNLLNRVQSCNDNHLLLGANCEEDHPLMKSYSNHLREEMEQIEEKTLTTEIGGQVVFKFELIPSDMKWMSSHLWELNNCATYFPPFANVNQTHKGAMVLLVALKQHGNHGSTPRDWPLQRKWKSQRKDLKIPWANKEVILQIYCSKQVETRICSSVGEVCWFTQGGAST